MTDVVNVFFFTEALTNLMESLLELIIALQFFGSRPGVLIPLPESLLASNGALFGLYSRLTIIATAYAGQFVKNGTDDRRCGRKNGRGRCRFFLAVVVLVSEFFETRVKLVRTA